MASSRTRGPNPRDAFVRQLPRRTKRTAGRTSAARTPLAIRTSGMDIDAELARYVRHRLGVRMSKFAPRIERATVRFEDVNGPRGGRDVVCRIKVVISGMPSVLVQRRAREPRETFDLTVDAAERSVRRALERRKFSARLAPAAQRTPSRRARAGAKSKTAPKRRPLPAPPQGSAIGRRVGRSDEKVLELIERPDKTRRDRPVDTARPGWSATDRRAGGASTAARNVKGRIHRASAALEDSATGRPSRKSTRKSANRLKQDTGLRAREIARARSPKTRAIKAAVAR